MPTPAAIVKAIVDFFGRPEVHRAAAATVVALVAIQGFISVHGVDFGLDQNSIQTIVGVIGGATVVARELVNPVILPFIKALLTGASNPNS